MGRRTTPLQIEAEWLEYKMIFDDVLTRFSAQLARQAKAERAALKRQLQEPAEPAQVAVTPPTTRKAQLRSRAAVLRGLGPLMNRPGGGQMELLNGHGDDEDDEP